MASPDSPSVEPSDTEGEGLLETIGAQLATLAAQVSEIDQRMSSVESGAPAQPVEVRLSPDTVAQIADALAALQAAGSQALEEAFKTASDDLTDALSGLVRSEISRTLTDAGYTVEVTEAAAPAVTDEPFEHDNASAVMPSIVAPLASSSADAARDVIGPGSGSSESIRDASDDEAGDGGAVGADRPPLALDELDDPFLDALIRKEPLSA